MKKGCACFKNNNIDPFKIYNSSSRLSGIVRILLTVLPIKPINKPDRDFVKAPVFKILMKSINTCCDYRGHTHENVSAISIRKRILLASLARLITTSYLNLFLNFKTHISSYLYISLPQNKITSNE